MAKNSLNISFYSSKTFLMHDTGTHPECAERLTSICNAVEGIIPKAKWIEPEEATEEQLSAIHTKEHIQKIKESCKEDFAMLDADTAVCSHSYKAAAKAAGAGCMAVQQAINGGSKKAFLAVRPPGHHAEADKAMGFCLFNNIAIAAKYAISLGLKRIAIVDVDVHHGNGTQKSFYNSSEVLYISLHEWGIFPGTGSRDETGTDDGRGYTVNFPLPEGSDDDRYLSLFSQYILPKLHEYQPELLLLSAGFDAHETDPIGGMKLTDDGFYKITRLLSGAADELCNGKLISFLEGGYNLQTVGSTAAAHIRAMAD